MDRYATLRQGLVGAWLASGNAGGLIARDLSPYRNNGTLRGSAAWIGSGSGSAFSFNGTTANVAATDAYWLKPTTAVSVSAWAFAIGQTGYVAFKKNSRSSSFEGYAVYADTNVWGAAISSAGGTQSLLTSAKTLNRWTHVCLTFSRPTMTLYIDGRVAGSRTHDFDLDHSTQPFTIGRSSEDGFPFAFSGYIDDVRVYSRAITRAEVQTLAMQRGIGLLPTRHRRGSALAQFWLNVAGTWKTARPWINAGGTWKVGSPKIRVSGTWKG